MQERDEFDSPDFKSALGAIFQAFDRRDSIRPRKPVWAAAIVVSLIVFLISVLVYSYPRKPDTPDEAALPVIRADAGSIKVAPHDPGGMDIPYRDSTVFETLHAANDAGAKEGRLENLLDEEEAPVSREALFSGLKAEIRVEGREVADVGQVSPAAVSAPIETVQSVPEEMETADAAPVLKAVPPVPPQKDMADEVSRAEPAAGVETFEPEDTAGKKGYFTQLGSLSSSESAQKAWADLQKGNPALKEAGYRIKTADLGARGVYYRVQAGPFSEAKAREICAAIEAKKSGGCLVVKD